MVSDPSSFQHLQILKLHMGAVENHNIHSCLSKGLGIIFAPKKHRATSKTYRKNYSDFEEHVWPFVVLCQFHSVPQSIQFAPLFNRTWRHQDDCLTVQHDSLPTKRCEPHHVNWNMSNNLREGRSGGRPSKRDFPNRCLLRSTTQWSRPINSSRTVASWLRPSVTLSRTAQMQSGRGGPSQN